MNHWVLGNWKSHGTRAEVDEFYRQLELGDSSSESQWGIAFPYGYTERARDFGLGHVGSQNVSEYGPGAYTGEVHAAMLKDCGCDFALVGHSERRQYFAESNETLKEKLRLITEQGMWAVYCIGETLQQREAGQLESTLDQQISLLDQCQTPSLVLVAYEPVWAIGTGRAATTDDVTNAHGWIKQRLKETPCADAAILYGGSVKPGNAGSLAKLEDVDGFLIGGASLNAESFSAIYRSFNQAKNA